MQVKLEYGKQGYLLTLPDEYQVDVLKKPVMPIIENVWDALNQSFSYPAGAAPLETVSASKTSVCIAICDITRPVPNGVILPVLIKRLITSGISKERICILVATGLHGPNEGPDLLEVVGDPWTLSHIDVVNHFARKDEDHADLGLTANGTRVLIDRRFVEADLKIVIGLVEPHFMAGFSGGRKLIVPGLSHAETIRRIHSNAFLGNGLATNCNLDGNPLHMEQLEIAKLMGEVYAINVVLDDRRNVGFVNFGELVQSHHEAIAFLRMYAQLKIDRCYKTIVTSAAGYPLDSSYYQTVKAMTGAMLAMENGGSMFVVSSCKDGLGSSEYRAAQKKLHDLGISGFLADIAQKTHADVDEWQTQMQIRAMKRCNINLFTRGLDREEKRLTCVNMVDDMETAITKWVETCGDRTVAVIPEGPYVIPMPQED